MESHPSCGMNDVGLSTDAKSLHIHLLGKEKQKVVVQKTQRLESPLITSVVSGCTHRLH